MKEYVNLYDNGGMTFSHNWFENYFTITS